ncbi:MAG TPA: ABC transporter substrate-binding protein [Bordetella sp.]
MSPPLKSLPFGRAAALACLALLCRAAYAEPIAFTDMLGNKVTLAGPTVHAVTVPMPASSLFMSLDGGPAHLAGMHPTAYALMRDGLLARIFPQAAGVRSDITRSGFTPNVETLLQMRPDLVWQWGHMGDDLLAPLRNAGLPVAALRYGTEADTREWIRLMGMSLDRQAQARQQLQWRDQVHAAIARVTDSMGPAERPKVLYLARRFPQYRAAGRNTNFEDDITLAGGRNVASSVTSSQPLDVEQILAWAPEVILLNNFERALTPQTIYQDPLLADVPAVRNRRVYKVPEGGYLWDPPNQESPLYWQWLSVMLHPDKFDWPLRALIAQAYPRLYGYTPSEQDIDAVLRTAMNDGSAGYERFH